MKTSVFLLAVLLVPASVVAAENPWSGFYDAATLTGWSSRVVPGIEQTLREDLLPRVPPESRQALRGMALRFPPEDGQTPFGFKSRWDAKAIVLPVSSMRLFRDLCVAYAWLSHNGYTTDTVSDYLTMLRSQWPSDALRHGKHTPLEVLGVPADAMNDPRVELIATANFSSGMTFIMGHELGHIAYRHPAYSAVSRAEARANESKADEFALELMKQLGVAPIGVVIFFTAVAHWELDGMATADARGERTHPLNADRINRVGQWLRNNADAFSRSAANPAKARAELDHIAPQFFKISDALGSEGANVVLRLRGLTATMDGLNPRRPDAPLIPLRADAGKPFRRWDGVFTGQWISAGGSANAAAMQLSPTGEGVRGFYVFGAGRVRLEGEADGNELQYRWTLDDANRGTGVLRVSADGRQLTGTWKRESDGYTASWKLQWSGYAINTSAATTQGRADRATPERPRAGGRAAELGFAGADDTPRKQSRADVTDADVQRAFTAIDQAQSYRDLVDVLARYQDIIASARALEWVDKRLQVSTLTANQRGTFVLARQTALDCREQGPNVAAQLLSVRLIAGYALVADTPQQFAAVLERFSGLAPAMDARLVRAALDTPGNTWPKPLLPLMEQLARDWPTLGTLAAATRMADAAKQAPGGPQANEVTSPSRGAPVVGHWRTTRIVFDSARDDHMVLRADGAAETWSVTASSRGSRVSGRWSSTGSTLNVVWENGNQVSQPFTMYQGQLVFPNIQGKRRFWERLE
jgi:hypothetical protein